MEVLDFSVDSYEVTGRLTKLLHHERKEYSEEPDIFPLWTLETFAMRAASV